MSKHSNDEIESFLLEEYAARSNNEFLNHRNNNETIEQDRMEYQHDRDRIVHSRAFRRLMHKTQIFNANTGDHYRNRLTHTLEVNQIARSIGKKLSLNDELIESIALGHDLGHTPYGHIGERTLHLIISGQKFINDSEIQINNFGGFKHNYQGIQLVDNIEKSNNAYNGINLTLATREGILKHTGSQMKMATYNDLSGKIEIIKQKVNYSSLDLKYIQVDNPSFTLEGQVVAISDEIAQCTHDLEDGFRAGVIKMSHLLESELINNVCDFYRIDFNKLEKTVDIRNTLIKKTIGFLINNVVTNSLIKINGLKKIPKFKDENDVFKDQIISFSTSGEDGNVKEMHDKLSKIISTLVVASQQVSQSDAKAEYIISRLFKAYFIHPQQLPDYILERYFSKSGRSLNRLKIIDIIKELQTDPEFIRLICDHISCMTDQYAAREYIKLYEPEYF